MLNGLVMVSFIRELRAQGNDVISSVTLGALTRLRRRCTRFHIAQSASEWRTDKCFTSLGSKPKECSL